jgi:hypothetical protein
MQYVLSVVFIHTTDSSVLITLYSDCLWAGQPGFDSRPSRDISLQKLFFFFLDFVHRLYFNKITTFWKLDLLPSSGKMEGQKP